jgi:peptidyl-dipeptidase A
MSQKVATLVFLAALAAFASGAAAMVLMAATPCLAQDSDHGGAPTPTAQDAKAFVTKAEAELTEISERFNRIEWIATTFITDDTNWLKAKVDAELATLQATQAKQAANFDRVDVDPIMRRKLVLLKRNLVLAPPDRPGAAEELSNISVRLDTIYSTGKVEHQGKELTLDDIAEVMRTSRDPSELKELWEKWHAVAAPMREDYARLVSLANEGARQLGYADTGVLWRSWYDMPQDQFGRTMDRLWSQIEPFYESLHCYTRARLNDKYGDAVQPLTGPIGQTCSAICGRRVGATSTT